MTVYDKLNVKRAINARSYSTKSGGCRLPSEVVEAMAAASRSCVCIDELQQAASRVIARVTGAEAGIVTSGGAAALTLAAAACMAGLDVAKMEQLPDTSDTNNEIVMHRAHRNDYDHALRLAGACLMEVGFFYQTFRHDVERAINSRTAALFYLADGGEGVLPLDIFVGIAHRREIPVIVDASAVISPSGDLRRYIDLGADLVVFSGGKHIRGPQASGILCGRKELVLSATLQHQDMDVFPETWPRRDLITCRKLDAPPHHGIGRGFKVGKEEIVGLVKALDLYEERDFEAESRRWRADVEAVIAEVDNLPGVNAEVVHHPTLAASIRIDATKAGCDAVSVVNWMQENDPRIVVFEKYTGIGVILVMPQALEDGEAAIIGRTLRSLLLLARSGKGE